jgi:hypothetical protein
MLPVLFPTLLASLPTGPGAALAITAATLTYVLTPRAIKGVRVINQRGQAQLN